MCTYVWHCTHDEKKRKTEKKQQNKDWMMFAIAVNFLINTLGNCHNLWFGL